MLRPRQTERPHTTPMGAPANGLIKARREGVVMVSRKKKTARNHNNIAVMETGPLLYTLVGAIVIVLVIQGMLLATVFWSQVQNTHAHFSSPQRVLDGAILDQDQAAAAVVRSKQQREQPQLLRHQIPLQEKTGEKRKANSGNASAPKQARPLPATTEEQVKFVSVNLHAPQHMSKDQLIQSQLQKHEESLQDYRVTTAIGHQSPDLMSPSVEAAMCSEHEHIPFVIMAFRRVEYLKQMIASLLASDFPHETVPIVISHDGRVPEMMEYVESLLNDREHNKLYIIQLIHPHSCYEHPHSFPGNDTSLNIGYAGDSFGNPRSAWATCCKHHFTWMMNTVFRDLEVLQPYDTFFFLEEDYVVSRTVYSSLCQGTKTIQLKEQMIQNENEIRNQKQSAQRIAEPIGSNHDEPQPQDVYFGVVGVEPTLRKPRMYDVDLHGRHVPSGPAPRRLVEKCLTGFTRSFPTSIAQNMMSTIGIGPCIISWPTDSCPVFHWYHCSISWSSTLEWKGCMLRSIWTRNGNRCMMKMAWTCFWRRTGYQDLKTSSC